MSRNVKCFVKWTVFAVTSILCVFVTACGGEMDPFSYRNLPFFAEIHGTVRDVGVDVLFYADLTEHVTKEIYDVATVEYRQPAALNGLVITKRSNGTYAARLGEIRAEGDFSHMIEPFLSLLDVKTEYAQIRKGEDGGLETTVVGEDCQLTYMFATDRTALTIKGTLEGMNLDLNIKLRPFAKERE